MGILISNAAGELGKVLLANVRVNPALLALFPLTTVMIVLVGR
jgi:hypothetical protein